MKVHASWQPWMRSALCGLFLNENDYRLGHAVVLTADDRADAKVTCKNCLRALSGWKRTAVECRTCGGEGTVTEWVKR